MATTVDISTLESRIEWAKEVALYRMLCRKVGWEVRNETIELQVELCHHFAEGVGLFAWQATEPPAGSVPVLAYRQPDGTSCRLEFPQRPLDIHVQDMEKVPIIYGKDGRELILTGKMGGAASAGPSMEDYLALIEASGQPILDRLANISCQPAQPLAQTPLIQPAPSPQPVSLFGAIVAPATA